MQSERATGTLQDIGSRDHSSTAEYRIFGPPGTGKTTNLTRQIRRAVDRFGPDSVLVTVSPGRPPPNSPGATCRSTRADRHSALALLRALGAPPNREANVDEWNRQYPQLQLTPTRKRTSSTARKPPKKMAGPGPAICGSRKLNRFRGLMIPSEGWSANLRDFSGRWSMYKRHSACWTSPISSRLLPRCAVAPNGRRSSLPTKPRTSTACSWR
jgi:hypothetical protein